jgi:hypothetical protein
VKQYTLAGLVLTLGAASAFAATPSTGETGVTNSESFKTVRYTHETAKSVKNYVTKVLGLATWDGPGCGEGFVDRVVVPPTTVAEGELQHVLLDTEKKVQQELQSTGGRGQIEMSTRKDVSSSSQVDVTIDKVETSNYDTMSITFGPDTIQIGDLDAGGTDYVLAAGETNYNTIHTTQIDTHQTRTTTDNQTTTYTVSGELYSSPIVLDLSGTGKIAASDGHWQPHPKTFYKTHRVMFDFFGNGFPVAMEWVGETDGLLVRPKSDGSVDGTCLFGSATGFTNGYEHLATLDANMDGHVSGKELAGLSVWQDKNGNGKADAGEVQTVQQLGISDFNLKHSDFKSSYTMKGKTQTMYDWWPTMFELKKNKQPV